MVAYTKKPARQDNKEPVEKEPINKPEPAEEQDSEESAKSKGTIKGKTIRK